VTQPPESEDCSDHILKGKVGSLVRTKRKFDVTCETCSDGAWFKYQYVDESAILLLVKTEEHPPLAEWQCWAYTFHFLYNDKVVQLHWDMNHSWESKLDSLIEVVEL